MYVDVHLAGPEFETQERRRMSPLGQQVSVSLGDRWREGVSLHNPAVNGDVQVAAGRETHGERADETPHHGVLERNQAPRERVAVDLRDALPEVGRRGERQGASPVRAEEEPDLRPAQGERFDHCRYRVRLGKRTLRQPKTPLTSSVPSL